MNFTATFFLFKDLKIYHSRFLVLRFFPSLPVNLVKIISLIKFWQNKYLLLFEQSYITLPVFNSFFSYQNLLLIKKHFHAPKIWSCILEIFYNRHNKYSFFLLLIFSFKIFYSFIPQYLVSWKLNFWVESYNWLLEIQLYVLKSSVAK